MNHRNIVRTLIGFTCLLLASLGFSQESYLGLYLQGQKIGYAYSDVSKDMSTGKELTKTVSETIISAAMLGDSLSVRITTLTLSNEKGEPQLMKFSMDSAGRTQKVEANFIGRTIQIQVDNSGTKSKKTIQIPAGAKIVDDAVGAMLAESVPVGTISEFFVLDSTTVSLVKNTVTVLPNEKLTLAGKEYTASVIQLSEPRAVMKIYLSSKGDLLKIIGPMGIEMLPITKEEALANNSSPKNLDLAALSRIVPNKPITDIPTIKRLEMTVSGSDLSAIPNGGHQTTAKLGSSWIVKTHPVGYAKNSATILAAAKAQPAWVKPGLNIPSSSAEMVRIAREVVGGSKTVREAATKIQRHVTSIMRPNAGIGVLRNATEVLATKEGVCRDYAILTATLLRAAGIPTRLCSGLIYQDGAFYYHAWNEVFDGSNWVGVDATRPDGMVRAGHLKLAHGSVESAFMFTFLDKAAIKITNIIRK